MKINLHSENTRFAPSPTGHMHLGHVFSALFAYEVAKKLGVCATALKKLCRKYGIARWPHRKLQASHRMGLRRCWPPQHWALMRSGCAMRDLIASPRTLP